MAVQQLGEYAETLSPSVTRAVSFGEPRVHIETRGQTRAPEITDWRAYLQLTNADDPAGRQQSPELPQRVDWSTQML